MKYIGYSYQLHVLSVTLFVGYYAYLGWWEGDMAPTNLYIAGLILGLRPGNERRHYKGSANLESALHNGVLSLLLCPIDLVSFDALLYFYDNKHILILILNSDSYKLVTGVL